MLLGLKCELVEVLRSDGKYFERVGLKRFGVIFMVLSLKLDLFEMKLESEVII